MTAAAILTGGLARRFGGRDKSRLEIGGRTILERQLEAIASVTPDILIVTSAARAGDFRDIPGARLAVDRHPGTGPLGAILTALDATPADPVAVFAGDMPGLTPALVAALLRAALDDPRPDAAVARSPRGLEPLAAAYARSARGALIAQLASGDLSLRGLLARLTIREVAPDSASFGDAESLFRNINTPKDL